MSARNLDIEQTAPWVVDRRVFMGTLAAASAVSLLPLPAAAAVSPQSHAAAPALLGDWHIDDQWGVYPRFVEPIAYGRPATDDAVADGWSAL
jgi:hypothetical protein